MVCIVDRTVQVLTRPPLGLSSDVRSESRNPSIRAQNDEKLSRKSCEFMPQHASATFTAARGPEALRERYCEARILRLRALSIGGSGRLGNFTAVEPYGRELCLQAVLNISWLGSGDLESPAFHPRLLS